MQLIQHLRTVALVATVAFGIGCGDSSTAPGDIESNYTITALGDGNAVVAGLNDNGQVVVHLPATTNPRNALIDNGATTDLGACTPVGLNDATVVACADETLWRDGATTSLPFPEGFGIASSGVNNQGVTAGTGAVPFSQGQNQPCSIIRCAFIAASGRVVIIEAPTGQNLVDVPRITNGSEVVVFTSGNGNAPSGAIWAADSTSIPYACAGLPVNSSLHALGGTNEVVGTAEQPGDPENTDAIVCQDGVMRSLGSETRDAKAISRSGIIVGTTDDGHGFLWKDGKLSILDDIGGRARVTDAYLINDVGQIVVTASGAGVSQTLLLTPR